MGLCREARARANLTAYGKKRSLDKLRARVVTIHLEFNEYGIRNHYLNGEGTSRQHRRSCQRLGLNVGYHELSLLDSAITTHSGGSDSILRF